MDNSPIIGQTLLSNHITRKERLLKVEIFHSVDSVKLQSQINEYLNKNPGLNVIDIKFQHVLDEHGEHYFSAMIIYKQ
ncbi:MAG: hypothetical protein COW00_01740 [Bdellovibrio sp. CG12_big_fil_rev_8_21_14_0_65_39_13]|nr:MAG: hypothetical protein COW78_03490 [Bdellovibrio sp. CG22_combo_CG10-13_8_21_14_all_39_27]PIQ62432.1 MAG: hypothetical protein COW00_01740 [Bdellovibrio sp. CG12_big_fil_rev_8_21_14_0_65_39_13]PIR34099.1 MAG: hypothetical protein COV37_14220 [Bdellovibrio sp. CG11_big_fil_rev_8_21_14_0_20_39_38]PJB53683.1 MAG: hypothetical protein CO099_05820 [Bdellovibrio sp. CG_4_9_14_3_um_filter_39_7]